MKKYYSRRRFELFIFFVIVLVYTVKLISGFFILKDSDDAYYTAKILSIKGPFKDNYEETGMKTYKIKIRYNSGEFSGKEVSIDFNELENDIMSKMNFSVSDDVLVVLENKLDITSAKIEDYSRYKVLIFIVIIFFILIVLIGGEKGFISLLSLLFSLILIFEIFIPLVLKGWSPLFLAVVICFISTGTTLISVCGFNPKTYSAILGISFGIVVASLLSVFFGRIMHLTGVFSEESLMLIYSGKFNVDFQGLLFSGMIIGAVGALMDIGISISSAVYQVSIAGKKLSPKKLFAAGMDVGKDIMGTMTNTLVLAYVGESIFLILLIFIQHNYPMVKIFNLELVASEILRSVIGGIGLLITIPITAFFASIMINRDNIYFIEEE